MSTSCSKHASNRELRDGHPAHPATQTFRYPQHRGSNNVRPISPNRPELPLNGKVALVTGAASGIGAAVAEAFAAKGAKVAVLDINADQARAKAEALGADAKPFVCDVSDPASVKAAVSGVVEAFGQIDIAVNSAGVVFLAPAEDLTISDWDRTIAINLKGSFLVTQEVGRAMIAAGKGGKIVNLASQAGTVAIEEHVAYCASKFGVIGMSKTFAAEWGKYGITVNTISPTIVLTELGKKARTAKRAKPPRSAFQPDASRFRKKLQPPQSFWRQAVRT